MKKEISPQETKISGKWIETQSGVSGDEFCNRVEYLTESYLERIAVDETGWDVLYRDPNDGRLWVKSFPKSELHGGGPPELAVIVPKEAQKKFSYG